MSVKLLFSIEIHALASGEPSAAFVVPAIKLSALVSMTSIVRFSPATTATAISLPCATYPDEGSTHAPRYQVPGPTRTLYIPPVPIIAFRHAPPTDETYIFIVLASIPVTAAPPASRSEPAIVASSPAIVKLAFCTAPAATVTDWEDGALYFESGEKYIVRVYVPAGTRKLKFPFSMGPPNAGVVMVIVPDPAPVVAKAYVEMYPNASARTCPF